MNYCTLFNSQYLSRGLALYNSLLRTSKNFHLIIFAFDNETYQILTTMQLQYVTVVSLKEFETEKLLKVKPTRSLAEYCWTCTASVILHCLEVLNLTEVCYLDADLFFWHDPNILIQEAQNSSILITEHRYTKEYDHAALSGKYCVQFMYFKNDTKGIKALHWWRDACLEWCFNRCEEGKFGDQKYLDDWCERFEGVHVLENLGGGVAPWNVQQYNFIGLNTAYVPVLTEKATNQKFLLVFYHFHGLKFINNHVDMGSYKLSNWVKDELYHIYISELLSIEKQLNKNELLHNVQSLNIHCKSISKHSWVDKLRVIKKRLLGNYNVVRIAYGKNN